MRKLSLIVLSLVALSLAPAALAQCSDCIDDQCYWGDPPEYWAADCWYEWCPPCGCYTTGRCWPLAQAAKPELAAEFQIASVEIRQGDVLIARKADLLATPIADKRSTLSHVQR